MVCVCVCVRAYGEGCVYVCVSVCVCKGGGGGGGVFKGASGSKHRQHRRLAVGTAFATPADNGKSETNNPFTRI